MTKLASIMMLAVAASSGCGGDSSGVASNAGGSGGTHASGGSGGTGASGGGGASGSGGTTASGGGGASAGAGGSAGVGGSGGVAPWTDLCTAPAGNFFAHGTFEEGMSGEAPTGWEVRNPSMPASCPGTPDQHVYISEGPTGCGGHALTIDALGQWDCYAVQRVSDYNTIEGGASYRVSASVRASGNSVNPAAWFVVGVQWLDANDAFFGDEKNPKTASAAENDYDWKVLQWDLVAPSNAKRILVWLSGHYPGKVDFDDVSVTKL